MTAVRARSGERAYAWFMDMLASLWLMAAVTIDFVFPGSTHGLKSAEHHPTRVRLPAHWRRW